MVTDYNYWEPKAFIKDTLNFEQSSMTIDNSDILIVQNNSYKRLIEKKESKDDEHLMEE